MVKDYQLLKEYGKIIRAKKFIIWGAGKNGRLLADQLNVQTDNIEFVDSDVCKVGVYKNFEISSPEKVRQYRMDDIAIVISSGDLNLEESILNQIESMGYHEVDTYTWYAMGIVLYYLNKKNVLAMNMSERDLIEKKIEDQDRLLRSMYYRQNILEQLFLWQVSPDSVFVYQSKKVGSITLTISAKAAGVYAAHIHSFDILELEDSIISNIIKNLSGKVITIVREPIARQVSLLWHYLGTDKDRFLRNYSSFEELESTFFSIPNREDEFEWYNKEIKKILGIDIYDFDFDREKGYSIIEKEGITLLLLKLEKIDSLENVIGNFLGVENFKLIYGNNSGQKGYKYAYEDYKKNVKVPFQFYHHYYNSNRYMDYFYTEEEKENFYIYWKNQIDELPK